MQGLLSWQSAQVSRARWVGWKYPHGMELQGDCVSSMEGGLQNTRLQLGDRRKTSIGVLLVVLLEKSRWPWFTWCNHLPGPYICPKRTHVFWAVLQPHPLCCAWIWLKAACLESGSLVPVNPPIRPTSEGGWHLVFP